MWSTWGYSAELHNRIAKIELLRKRYEIQMMFMSPPEGEEEHSQTYYVIKVCTGIAMAGYKA